MKIKCACGKENCEAGLSFGGYNLLSFTDIHGRVHSMVLDAHALKEIRIQAGLQLLDYIEDVPVESLPFKLGF